MKICFFGDSGSIHIQRWCKHFSAQGNEVHLITFNSVKIDGTTVYPILKGEIAVSGGNWKVLLSSRKIKRLVQQIKPDVFHAFYATSYGVTGALVNYHPYIITTLGSDVLISPKSSWIYRILLRFAFKRADLITAMSSQMHDEIIKIGAQSSKVTTLPFGIDPTIFNTNNRHEREHSFVITHTRNFEKIYNIPHFIRAIGLISNKVDNLIINMVGAGSLEQEIKEMVHTMGMDSVFKFHGKITQPKISEMLQQSNVFVSVSLSDGNNISLNEAMACGAYPIVSNIAANRQWIDDGVNGNLIAIDDDNALANAILNVANNYEELQKKAVTLSNQRIQDFGLWPNNMNRMADYYKKLLDGK